MTVYLAGGGGYTGDNDAVRMTASTMVDEKMSSSAQYAASAWQKTLDFIEELNDKVDFLTLEKVAVAMKNEPPLPEDYVEVKEHAPYSDVDIDFDSSDLSEPGALKLSSVVFPEDITFPDFSASLPSINIPNCPELNLPEAPECQQLNPVERPAHPQIEMPDSPDLENIEIPEPPTISIEPFNVEAPDVDELVPPIDGGFVFQDPVVSDEFKQLVISKLEYFIENDLQFEVPTSTASTIELTVIDAISDYITELQLQEESLWQRGRDRLAEELETSYDEIDSTFAARGFSMPTGMQVSARLEARNKINREITNLDRDIIKLQLDALVERTKLKVSSDLEISKIQSTEKAENARQETNVELENAKMIAQYDALNTDFKKHIIEKCVAFQSELIKEANAIAQRAFEAAMFAKKYLIDIYNARVAIFNTKIEAYKAEGAIYETKIRKVLADLESYKTQMEAAKIEASIQQLYVGIYKEKMDAVRIALEVYRTDVMAAEAQAKMEFQKIEQYKASVAAFSSIINAETTKYNAYQAQIAGESAKADVFSKQVEAYKSQVGAVGERVKSWGVKSDAISNYNKSLAEGYKAEIDLYGTKVSAKASEISSKIEKYNADIQRYVAVVDKEAKEAGLKLALSKQNTDREKASADVAIASADTNLQAAIEMNKVNRESIKAGAMVSAQLAASAWSSVSVSSSLGYSGSSNQSASWNESRSSATQQSDSLAVQHVYHHEG
jgi:hypothetical protein